MYERRAEKKAFGRGISYQLIRSVERLETRTDKDDLLYSAYWNSFYCSEIVKQKNNKLTSSFCKNRWCPVCGEIRTQELFREYLPEIESWEKKTFVTLTIPSVSQEELTASLDELNNQFSNVRRSVERSTEKKIKVLKKLEITFNSGSKTYHPHYHLIVEDTQKLGISWAIVKAWLKRFPDASFDAQKVQPADRKTARCLFRYFTKILDGEGTAAAAMHEILKALRGRRTLTAYGFKKSVDPDKVDYNEEVEAWTESERTILWKWAHEAADWKDEKTGQTLLEFEPEIAPATAPEKPENQESAKEENQEITTDWFQDYKIEFIQESEKPIKLKSKISTMFSTIKRKSQMVVKSIFKKFFGGNEMKYEQLREKNEQLENELLEAKKRTVEAEESLKIFFDKNNELMSEREDLLKQLSHKDDHCQHLNTEVENLTEQRDILKEEVQDLTADKIETAGLYAKIKELEGVVEAQKKALRTARQGYEESISRQNEWAADCHILQDEKSKLEKIIISLNHKLFGESK